MKEDKKLLLKDLSGRLPYGIKCNIYRVDDKDYGWRTAELEGIYQSKWGREFDFGDSGVITEFNKVKPYLFPLSSMTEEQRKEIRGLLIPSVQNYLDDDDCTDYPSIVSMNPSVIEIDYFNANHFDYRGLIEKSLALDATGLDIY